MNWFDVDKKGLAKLMAGRPKAFVLYELLQNAWDQKVTKVMVTISPIPHVPMTEIVVEDDDPDGFADLAHAYTLFAESNKKGNAEKRGRFNLGEKLVLALATEARIDTRRGAVRFDADGRHDCRSKRTSGSCISVSLPMTRAENQELLDAVKLLIVPKKIKTTVNGQLLDLRSPIAKFSTTLPTLLANEEGILKSTTRKTVVHVYELADGEKAMLYEMGIPIVETGDLFHVDIQQKIPLNMDRDNVTPGYLRKVRAEVLNGTHRLLEEDHASQSWVREACSDDRVSKEAILSVMGKRFGEGAVAYDPSDTEANKLSLVAGRPVVYGGSLSAGEWMNVRRAGALPAAGSVTPSPKPYSSEGKPLSIIPESKWTTEMRIFADRARFIGKDLLGDAIIIQFVRDPAWCFGGTFGPNGILVTNLSRIGGSFLSDLEKQLDFLIHEFAHYFYRDHLSDEYYKTLTKLGAKMTLLAIEHPEFFIERK